MIIARINIIKAIVNNKLGLINWVNNSNEIIIPNIFIQIDVRINTIEKKPFKI